MDKIKYLLFTFLLFVFSSSVLSQGNLLVHPSRVVFEGQKLKEDLMVTNLGKDSALYVVSVVNYRMKSDGSFERLQQPDSVFSADRLIRIFPRQIKLGPGESQTIKLQCRKPAEIAEGEYRSHLFFRAEKENAPLGLEKNKDVKSQMSVRIKAIFGISIPVIVRQGSPKVQLRIENVNVVSLTDSTSTLSFSILREGMASGYGDLRVDYVNKDVMIKDIAVANGLGVYPEISERKMNFLIKWPIQTKKNEGKLMIRYMDADKTKGIVFTAVEYELSK